ncbi:Lrp/AsnC ligand binding domain-containing protein [Catenulispora subtropica]|uniref:Lrp/AsnC ligand binding domain-containing protein n=1 Tax=Catenulispora subtropica TaxID=450798 RepID=UPI0031E24713
MFVVAGDNDFLVHVAVPSIERLHAFLMDRLSQRREIVGFQTVVIFQRTGAPIVAQLPPTTAATASTVTGMRASGGPDRRGR